MKKSPIFTLVRKLATEKSPSVKKTTSMRKGVTAKLSTSQSESRRLSFRDHDHTVVNKKNQLVEKAIRKVVSSKELQAVYLNLNENFKSTLNANVVSGLTDQLIDLVSPLAKDVSNKAMLITKDLARHNQVIRIGIIDLGAWIGELPMLIERLNASQPLYTFFEALAPIPGGLLKTPDGFYEWAVTHGGLSSADVDKDELEPQMIADEFFNAGNDIRKAMGFDFLVGITSALVAGKSGKEIYWNHFSSVSTPKKTILISSSNLRDFAGQANRPFEAAIGLLLVTALFVATNEKLGYHKKETGCIFDYKKDRVSLVEILKTMSIENSCKEKMLPEERDAADSLLGVLKRMKKGRKG